MKILCILFTISIICVYANDEESVYHGSTPAHPDVRDFLDIPQTDSIDFIRWKLVLRSLQYDLKCQFGVSKGGTSGFINEKEVGFSGSLVMDGDYYVLRGGDKTLNLLKINPNLFHLLDKLKAFLVGNGSYSYVLNTDTPIKSGEFNLQFTQGPSENPMAFEGRTPCQELSRLMGLDKSDACNKMKWYILLYVDAITKQPTYYLTGGRGYRKATMSKGNWEITRGKDGKLIYKLDPEKKDSAVYLLIADDNILFFTDPEGNLLVGNEDFSYTLNRTKDREPEINK